MRGFGHRRGRDIDHRRPALRAQLLQGGRQIVTSTMPLQTAMKRPLTRESFCDQFSRLGGTEFELGDVRFEVEGEVILPISELNRMRRELVELWSGDESLPSPKLKSTTTLESLMPLIQKGDESSPLHSGIRLRRRYGGCHRLQSRWQAGRGG